MKYNNGFAGAMHRVIHFAMVVSLGLLALCLISLTPNKAFAERLYTSPGTAYFTDADTSSWYAEEGILTKLYERDIMKGYGNTTLFGPEDKATRAQAITAIYRMVNDGDFNKLTFNRLNYEMNKTSLTDVKDNCYYTAAVNWAYLNGIVKGKDGNRFDPDAAITREELITLIGRAVEDEDFSAVADPDRGKPAVLDSNEDGATQQETALEFSGVSSYALSYIEWAHSISIINPSSTAMRSILYTEESGVSAPGTVVVLDYRPTDEATRIEMAAMLARLDDILLELA